MKENYNRAKCDKIMYRTRKVAKGKKEKKEALVFRPLRLHECYSPFPVYNVCHASIHIFQGL